MRWLLTTEPHGDTRAKVVGSYRTQSEGMTAGRNWLERRPHEHRLYLQDTRTGRAKPVTRKRVAHRHTRHTFKDRS